jgi:flagellar basal body-associated protein FliL
MTYTLQEDIYINSNLQSIISIKHTLHRPKHKPKHGNLLLLLVVVVVVVVVVVLLLLFIHSCSITSTTDQGLQIQ